MMAAFLLDAIIDQTPHHTPCHLPNRAVILLVVLFYVPSFRLLLEVL
jgi:hypothetical protein